jgi:hypothetical protein
MVAVRKFSSVFSLTMITIVIGANNMKFYILIIKSPKNYVQNIVYKSAITEMMTVENF